MIVYNMRERGALEYEKFALNILQAHNAINSERAFELNKINESKNSLVIILDRVNNTYNNLCGTSEKEGLCEKVYKKTVLRK